MEKPKIQRCRMDRLRFLVETYVDYQKSRLQYEGRLRSLPEELQEDSLFKKLAEYSKAIETSMAKEISVMLKEEPLYMDYLQYQKGIGPMMAGYLIGWLAKWRTPKVFGVKKKIDDKTYERIVKKKKQILRIPEYAKVIEEHLKDKPKYIVLSMPSVMEVAENPSKLHKYCGVSPGSRLKSDEKATFNPKVKTLMYKIFTQLLLAQGEWYKIFAKDKEDYAKRCPTPNKGTLKLKIHRTAKNIVMRKFMTSLWLVYRWQSQMSTETPYIARMIEQGTVGPGHTLLQPFLEKDTGIEPYMPPKTEKR